MPSLEDTVVLRKYYLDIYCAVAMLVVVGWLSALVIWGFNL